MPAWFATRFASEHPWRFLGVATRVSWRPFLGVVIVYLLALPAMNQIIAWNQAIHFPEWASSAEAALRRLEEANAGVVEEMMSIHTVWEMLVTVLVVGLLTGFSEELFFRGGLQNIFMRSHVKAWVAVWVTAFVFSAMHFQFFGFFPRVLMGAFFGYLLVWSGSLWPSVFAHALNNSVVVVATWLTADVAEPGIDNFGVAQSGFPFAALASAIATGLFFWRFRNFFFKQAE